MENITINEKIFEHIKTRAHTPVSVYKSADSYLRRGPKDLLEPEIAFHKSLLGYGFPVPKILEEGEIGSEYYYIEESFGDMLLGELFIENYEKDGKISESSFSKLLKVSKDFARAQLKTVQEKKDEESFYLGAHVDYILQELPTLKEKTLQAFQKAKDRTSAFPYVLTHGDFNPHNLFAKGVIDFGSVFHAPAGYDTLNNIYHTYNFPKEGDFESMRRYEFTEEQIVKYLSEMDKIYVENGLPKISEYKNDFLFPRIIWSVVRMERYPRMQKWRYERYEVIVEKYLKGEGFVGKLVKK